MSVIDPARWQQLRPWLDRAFELDESDRAAWLGQLRGERPALAAKLQQLLGDHQAGAGRTVGAYRLISLIGEGGMGSVWLAERSDGRFERHVAIKFPRLSLTLGGAERFRREGAILGSLAHPNIAQLLDAGITAEGQPYLVIEYVEGERIDEYCARHALDPDARVRLMLDVIAAVAQAHASLVVHRDLKPSNVLVGHDGRVKLLDFGIAKLLDDESQLGVATVLTRDAGAAMTPAFASPEQLTGGAITTATDVYALGILLALLVTGEHPAGDGTRSPANVLLAILSDEPSVRLRGDLATIVRKALKKDPAERYASAAALGDDLRRYLRNEPISARPDTVAYRTRKFVRRNRTVVALTGAALAGTIAGLIGTIVQARTARTERDRAVRELSRSETIAGLNTFLLSDAAPAGKPFTVDDLLARAETIVKRQRGDPANRAELLVSIGHQYTVQDNYARAEELLQEARTLARQTSERSTRSRAACALAQVVASGSGAARAEALIDEGLAELTPDPEFVIDRINCLLRGSEVADRLGAAAHAVERAETAARVIAQLPFRSELLELDTQIALASAYNVSGRHHDANEAFARASSTLAALGRADTQRAATVLNNWGVSLWLDGQPLESARVLRRALDIITDNEGDRALAPMPMINYARALQDLAQFSEAAEYAERGYTKAHRAGAGVVEGQALLLEASIWRQQGKLPDARDALDRVDAAMRSSLPPGHIAFSSLASQRSLLAQAAGDPAGARERANEAVAIAERSVAAGNQGRDYLVLMLTRRADIEREAGDTTAALADAERSVTLARAATPPRGFSVVLGRAYVAHGRALAAAGRVSAAHDAYDAAIPNLEQTLGANHPESQATRHLATQLENW